MTLYHQIPRSQAGRDYHQDHRGYRQPASPAGRASAPLPLRPTTVTQRSRSGSSGSSDDYCEQQRYHHHQGIMGRTPQGERRIITRNVENFRDVRNKLDDDIRGRRGRRSLDDPNRLMIPRAGGNVYRRRGSHDGVGVGEGSSHSRSRVVRGRMPSRSQSHDVGDVYRGSRGPSTSMPGRYHHGGPPHVVPDSSYHSRSNDGSYHRRYSTPQSPSSSSSPSTRFVSSPSFSSSPGYAVGSDAAYIDYVLMPDNIDMSQFAIHSFQRKKDGNEMVNTHRSADGDTLIGEDEDITALLSSKSDSHEVSYYHSVQYRNEVVWILETKCMVYDNDTHYHGDTSTCTLSKNSSDGVVCIKICHQNGAADNNDNLVEALSSSFSSLTSSPRTSQSPCRGEDESSRSRSTSPGPLSSRTSSRSTGGDPGGRNVRRSPSMSSSRRYTEDLRDILRRSAAEYEREMTKGG